MKQRMATRISGLVAGLAIAATALLCQDYAGQALGQEALRPGLGPENVLVVYNRGSVDSEAMARYYRGLRGLAANRLCPVSVDRYALSIPMEEFRKFRAEILGHLAREKLDGDIRCVLLMCDIPQGVHTANSGRAEYLALDSMLAEIRATKNPPSQANRYMARCRMGTKPGPQGFTREMQEACGGMVLVSRIEAPGLLEMKAMLDGAQAGEASARAGKPMAGTFYIDLEPSTPGTDAGKNSAWDAFNRSMQACGEIGKALGRPVVVENSNKRLTQFASGPAAFYVGWYTLDTTINRGQDTWAPGAIAIEIHSSSARLLKQSLKADPYENSYVAFFASHGVAATYGAFREPYLQAFPPPGEVLGALRGGLTWAESTWCNLPQVNWEMEIIGDPLYRPFAGKTP